MKLNYVELHRGNNETFRVDFNTSIEDNYNENYDIPAVGLIKEGANKFNGLKICVDKSKNKLTNKLRRFYRFKHKPMRYFEDYRISRQRAWENLDNFKYMLISENHNFLNDGLDFKIGNFVLWAKLIKIKDLLKMCNNTIKCICINLEEISNEDRRLNHIVCNNGTIINIDELCKEFSILLDFNTTSTGKKYGVESNTLEDVVFILDDKKLFIMDVSSNINLSNMMYLSNMAYVNDMDTNKIIRREVFKDLYYLRLSMLSGDCIINF